MTSTESARTAAQSSTNKGVDPPRAIRQSGWRGDSPSPYRIAARQHGAFNIAQARAAGFDRSAVHYRIRNGTWISLDDSVYAVVSAPRTWRQMLWAAVLSRRRAVAAHWSACRLLGAEDIPDHVPTILVPRGSNTRSSLARIFESDQFERIAVARIEGLPVTTMPETILTLARDVEAEVLTSLFDGVLLSGKLDLKAMSAVIDREAGRRTPGTPLLRRLTSSRLASAPSRSSSYLERLLEIVLHDPRLPLCTREYQFSLDGLASRVDFYVPSARVVIEGDGRNWHAKWQAFESDRRRDNALAARGIQVLRFTYEMLKSEPEKCLEQTITTCLLRAA